MHMTASADLTTKVYEQSAQVIEELIAHFPLNEQHVLVFGVSTSEIAGARIGTHGSEEIAAAVYEAIREKQSKYKFNPAIQCCEHLNRALLVEQSAAERFAWEAVSVIPVPNAGGALAAYAYRQFKQPLMVEHIQADAGIDIGDTLIGMHLKRVAVPFRGKQKQVGKAHVTTATTRPKLIGGPRAVYILD